MGRIDQPHAQIARGVTTSIHFVILQPGSNWSASRGLGIIRVGAGKFWGCEGYFARISSIARKIFVRQTSPTNFLWQLVTRYQLSRTLKHEDFLFSEVKKIFFEKKCPTFHSVRLIDHSIGKKGVETFVPEFLGILPEFSTNQNFWGWACPPCPSNSSTTVGDHWSNKTECNSVHIQLST